MIEKVFKTNIKKKPDYEYEVLIGGCVLMRGKHPEDVDKAIYWISFEKAEELYDTWQKYNYFVDDDGDISRELINERS